MDDVPAIFVLLLLLLLLLVVFEVLLPPGVGIEGSLRLLSPDDGVVGGAGTCALFSDESDVLSLSTLFSRSVTRLSRSRMA